MVELADHVEDVAPPDLDGRAPEPEAWKTSAKTGRQFIGRADGRQGVIYRDGDETVEQARARDVAAAARGDKRPHRKSKTPKLPPPAKAVDLKALEVTLAEALKAPAIACAMFGDEWAAEHFTNSGPYLARNLILASEHNPWLRRKLEEASTGQDAMMMMVSLVGVAGACFAYAVPPVIWWFNLPAPRKTREMFGIPERRDSKPAPHATDYPSETPEPAPYPPAPVFS